MWSGMGWISELVDEKFDLWVRCWALWQVFSACETALNRTQLRKSLEYASWGIYHFLSWSSFGKMLALDWIELRRWLGLTDLGLWSFLSYVFSFHIMTSLS
jgi:hypothetical protein